MSSSDMQLLSVAQSEATTNNGSAVTPTDQLGQGRDLVKGSSDVRILLHYIIIHHYHRRGERFWLNPSPFYCTQTPQYHRGEEDNSGRAGRFIRLLIVKESQFYLTLPNAPAPNSQPAAQLQ